MLAKLSKRFVVAALKPAADDQEIQQLRAKFKRLPPGYVELVGEATQIELLSSNKYFRIWGPQACIEMNEAYNISQRIPDAVPVGDDGGGEVIFYRPSPLGSGLYHVGFGDLDFEDAVFFASDPYDFLCNGVGLETF